MAWNIAVICSLVAPSAALNFSQWSPAGPGDSRAPCPGLNTMANHGILPHDGKGLTVPMLVKAMEETYNFSSDLATFFAVGGLLTTQNPLSLTYDLSDLDEHNVIEHDASLSRQDFNLDGNDHTFSPSIFDSFLSHFAGLSNTTVKAAALGRYSRVQNEFESDPKFTYGPTQIVLSYGESALYLEALGNGGSNVPLEWVKSFFQEERRPYELGWRTSSTEIGFLSLNGIILQLVLDSGEELPEGLIITNATLAKAFLGLNVLETEIPPPVQTLLNQFCMGSIL